jgi:SAM-dependent methyltransferase
MLSTPAKVVADAVLVIACLSLMRQLRKPSWLPGMLITRYMNTSHRSLLAWGLGHLALARDSTILDVGCGGGNTIRELALLAPDGHVSGVDYSAASVAVTRRTNAASIESGKVDVQQASVSHLPFAANAFDVVTAVETHYYWPDLESDLREVRRVLRPGGRVAILAESYRDKRLGVADTLVMRLLGSKLMTIDEHRAALAAAGFESIATFEDRPKGWLCVIGVKNVVATP